MLKFSSSMPSKIEIARSMGKTEGAIRALFKQLNDEEIEKHHLEYKKEKYPFLKIEEYLKIKNMDNTNYSPDELQEDVNNLTKKISSKNFTGSFYTDGNGISNVFIPTMASEIQDIKELFEENQIKMPITISIGNHKGGVGKTTNLTNIATSMAYFGFKVLIVDFDPQGNASASFGIFTNEGGNYKKETIIDLINANLDDNIEKKVREAIINIDLSDKFENGILGKVDLISNNAEKSELVERLPMMSGNLGTIENTLNRILSYIKDDYDFILIDLPPRADFILRTAIMASDYFIISLIPKEFAKIGMQHILNPIKKYEQIYKIEKKKDFKILGAIVGDYKKGITAQDTIYNQIQKDIEAGTKGECSIFNTFIPNNKIIDEVNTLGSGGVIFYEPCNQVTRSYMNLTLEVLERILINEVSQKEQ